jgi:hypothetical protein
VTAGDVNAAAGSWPLVSLPAMLSDGYASEAAATAAAHGAPGRFPADAANARAASDQSLRLLN